MRRREFIALLGARGGGRTASLRAPGGRADLSRRRRGTAIPRNAPIIVAMFDELRRLGFIEGQNLTIDWRTYGPRTDLDFRIEAACQNQMSMSFTPAGTAAIRAAQNATTTIPILGITEDMVGSGLVNSLARPGGNTTGVSFFAAELDGKRQEILIEAVPGIRRMAVLADPKTRSLQHSGSAGRGARTRRRAFNLSVANAEESGGHRRGKGFRRRSTKRFVVGLPLGQSPDHLGTRRGTASAGHVSMAGVCGGGRPSRLRPEYRPNFSGASGPQLVKLLRGAKPADIPVVAAHEVRAGDQPQDRKGTRAYNPRIFLVRADKVIE